MSQVTLKERNGQAAAGQDLQTVFSLSPVIQEGDFILFESYARIKHLATRTWLHLDRSEWNSQHTPSLVEVASVGEALNGWGLPHSLLHAYHPQSECLPLSMAIVWKPFIYCGILIASMCSISCDGGIIIGVPLIYIVVC